VIEIILCGKLFLYSGINNFKKWIAREVNKIDIIVMFFTLKLLFFKTKKRIRYIDTQDNNPIMCVIENNDILTPQLDYTQKSKNTTMRMWYFVLEYFKFEFNSYIFGYVF
jgi:hypothetical protein